MGNANVFNSYPAQSHTDYMKNFTKEHKKMKPALFVCAFLMIAVLAVLPFQNQITNLIASAAGTSADAAEVVYYLGDVDKNGKVESSDARAILRASVRLENFEVIENGIVVRSDIDTPNVAELADVDGSYTITSADARATLRMSVQLDPLVKWEKDRNTEEPIDPLPPEKNTEPKTEPEIPDEPLYIGDDVHNCAKCGKRMGIVFIDWDGKYNLPDDNVCWEVVGGCCPTSEKIQTCSFCGETIPSWSCHTCDPDKIFPEYKELIKTEDFKESLNESLYGLPLEKALYDRIEKDRWGDLWRVSVDKYGQVTYVTKLLDVYANEWWNGTEMVPCQY